MEWTLVIQSPEQSETEWLCVEVTGQNNVYKPPRTQHAPVAILTFPHTQGRNEVRLRCGKKHVCCPMFEPDVFRKQMNCMEESICDIFGTLRRSAVICRLPQWFGAPIVIKHPGNCAPLAPSLRPCTHQYVCRQYQMTLDCSITQRKQPVSPLTDETSAPTQTLPSPVSARTTDCRTDVF